MAIPSIAKSYFHFTLVAPLYNTRSDDWNMTESAIRTDHGVGFGGEYDSLLFVVEKEGEDELDVSFAGNICCRSSAITCTTALNNLLGRMFLQ